MNVNNVISDNFRKIKLRIIVPVLLIFSVFWLWIFSQDGNYQYNYIRIQEDLFFTLNDFFASFPLLEYNLTQLGDVLILYPLVAVLLIKAPKFWNVLLISSVFSLFISGILKKLFHIPRPALVLNNDLFMIVGRTLKNFKSHPSGHSITTFIVVTLILLSFMPTKKVHKLLWTVFMLVVGLFIALSRVAVGAHFPLDVLAGGMIGLTVLGIVIYNKTKWSLFEHPKAKIVSFVMLLIWFGVLIFRILQENLIIYYISLVSLIYPLWLSLKSLRQK